MEARLAAVEISIARIDATLPTLATKADVSEVKVELHKGFGIRPSG